MFTTGHLNFTAVGWNNAGLNARAAFFAIITVVELVRRPHLDVFYHERHSFPKINLHIKLMPSTNNFVCKSAAPAQNAQQENYKLVIERVNFIIRTKMLIKTACIALMDLLVSHNMVHHNSRVNMKQLSIPASQILTNFENVCTGALSDLVIVGLLSDAVLAGGYQNNPFIFQNFGLNRINLKCNDTFK